MQDGDGGGSGDAQLVATLRLVQAQAAEERAQAHKHRIELLEHVAALRQRQESMRKREESAEASMREVRPACSM